MIHKVMIISSDNQTVSTFTDFLLPLHKLIVVCSNAEDAFKSLETNQIDILIIDSKLHNITGAKMACAIRASNFLIPIVMLYDDTRSEFISKSETIGLGLCLSKIDSAEEWIKQTDSFMNQLAYLKSSYIDNFQMKYGSFMIAENSSLIFFKDQPLKLSDKERKLLLYFLKNSGKTVLIKELKQSAWNTEYVSESALTVYISSIRKKIENNPKNPTFLRTVWGEGYIFQNDESNS